MEEKFIQERLKHEKIESDMFDKILDLEQQLKLKDKMIEHCQDIFCLMLEDGVDVEYYKLQTLAELEE